MTGEKITEKYHNASREKYLKAKTKKKKSKILEEYCLKTGQSRKYVIRKIKFESNVNSKVRRRRTEIYPTQVKMALARVWQFFDYPCAQRLKPILENEVDRLREFGELLISDDIALKLKKMSPATINRKLKPQREELYSGKSTFSIKKSFNNQRMSLRAKRSNTIFYTDCFVAEAPCNDKPRNLGLKPLDAAKNINHSIVIKWDIPYLERIEADLFLHYGYPIFGKHVKTLNVTENDSGWWEGETTIGNSKDDIFQALEKIRERSPFKWRMLISDNSPEFINNIFYAYTLRENLTFSRLRRRRNNYNSYIIHGKWLNFERVLRFSKYDTLEEVMVLNALYRNELKLFKNFFQPIMKLAGKGSSNGKIKSSKSILDTPYQSLMSSHSISQKIKEVLKGIYLSLNPFELRRSIETKLYKLSQINENKKAVK